MAQFAAKNKTLNFSEIFGYAFRNKNYWVYLLWILVPIFGWFILSGYGVRVIQTFLEKNFVSPPKIMPKSDMKKGFLMFVKFLPINLAFAGVSVLSEMVKIFYVLYALFLFLIPLLYVNYAKKETFASTYEFGIFEKNFSNFKDYLFAFFRYALLALVSIPLCFILIGIPILFYSSYISFAQFYTKFVDKK